MSRLLYGNSDFFSLNPSGVPVVGQTLVTGTVIGMSGTGAPESKVAAPPGSTFLQTDSTTDVKGWIRWVKATGTGTTGWVAGPEADTGWRNVASVITAPANGEINVFKMRRLKDTVQVFIKYKSTSGATDNHTLTGTVPTGFTPASQVLAFGFRCAAEDGSTPKGLGYYTGTFYIKNETTDAAWGYITVIYPSVAAWPSSLPGSAA